MTPRLTDEELEELERKQLVASDARRLLSSLKHEREENIQMSDALGQCRLALGREDQPFIDDAISSLIAQRDQARALRGQLAIEVQSLKAENARLGEALEEITRWVVDKEVTGPTSVALHTIARRALTGDDE